MYLSKSLQITANDFRFTKIIFFLNSEIRIHIFYSEIKILIH
jgi:hypothetical protein